MKTYIHNLRIALENEFIENGALLLNGDKIAEIYRAPHAAPTADITFDAKGLTAVPGYIDSHVHGGNDFDCNDGTLESIEGVTEFYARHGITSYYPTLAADSWEALTAGFESIRAAMKTNRAGKPEVLGTHLEGPFFNKIYKGSQVESRIVPYEREKHLPLLKPYKDVIRRITVAPEVENNMEEGFADFLDLGMVITGGHSNATYTQAEAAVAKGMRGMTHLNNAMSQTRKEGPFRVCGMVEAGLNIDELYVELIADGFHLPDQLIQLAHRCKGADKMFICSDANRAAGAVMGSEIHTCGQVFYVENGVALNGTRTSLASSITPISEMVRKLILNVKLPPLVAFKMAATNVAKLMRIDDKKGSITVGKDADINLLDSDYNVVRTYCRGVESYVRK